MCLCYRISTWISVSKWINGKARKKNYKKMLIVLFHWKKALSEKSLTYLLIKAQLLSIILCAPALKERNEDKWPVWGELKNSTRATPSTLPVGTWKYQFHVWIKLMLLHGNIYFELYKENLKPKSKSVTWREWGKMKFMWKRFPSHQHICKCLEIYTAQARAVNKDEHHSQLLYHLSIWSTTVNAKFSSCKIDVNECLLHKRDYKVNIC